MVQFSGLVWVDAAASASGRRGVAGVVRILVHATNFVAPRPTAFSRVLGTEQRARVVGLANRGRLGESTDEYARIWPAVGFEVSGEVSNGLELQAL
jgi:hypothetical protein